MFKPITKLEFFNLAKDYGANPALASDLWYCRPIDKIHDSEDQVRGNFELMGSDWFKRMNELSRDVQRHAYLPSEKADNTIRCGNCGRPKISPAHNLEVWSLGPGVLDTPERRKKLK